METRPVQSTLTGRPLGASVAAAAPAASATPDPTLQLAIARAAGDFDPTHLISFERPQFDACDVDRLLIHASTIGASDIKIAAYDFVIVKVHGKSYRITRRTLSDHEVRGMLNYIYGANGEMRIKQGEDIDRSYDIRINRTQRYRYRVNVTGCYATGGDGMEITARTITSKPPSCDDIYLEPEIREGFNVKNGLIAVCGPTGNGKSTLLAAQLRSMLEDKESSRWILTYEAPIEYVYDEVPQYSNKIRQHEIPWHLKSGFAYAVRNSLRRAPDVILIGESRDLETISAALEASETGHMLLTTVHSNSVPETIYRIVNMFPSHERDQKMYEVIEDMRMIVVQWLVKKTGGGRIALREFLVLTPEIRTRLRAAESLRDAVSIAQRLVEETGQSMLMSAHKHLAAGRIEQDTYDYIQKLYEHRGILKAGAGASDELPKEAQ